VKRRTGSVPGQREKAQWGSTCPDCGKVRYLSRRHARARARVIKDGTHMNAYRCGDFWHLGHLPDAVRTGQATRDDLGGRP
jgi:hypothetical protein